MNITCFYWSLNYFLIDFVSEFFVVIITWFFIFITCALYDRVTSCHFHLDPQGFATPGTYQRPDCEGRLCTNCGYCRDWYYTGDVASWQWIRNCQNWNDSDRKHYRDGNHDQKFQRRDGSTCRSTAHRFHDLDIDGRRAALRDLDHDARGSGRISIYYFERYGPGDGSGPGDPYFCLCEDNRKVWNKCCWGIIVNHFCFRMKVWWEKVGWSEKCCALFEWRSCGLWVNCNMTGAGII